MARIPKKNQLDYDEPQLISPDDLALDRENPRLMLSGDGRASEDAIIKQLYKEGELGELLQSIGANGYLDFEPLIVFRDGAKGPYTVLEGNRRLAALKLFRLPMLANKLEISLPAVNAKNRNTLDEIRVIRVRSRADARTFIGFKHINGAHRWDSYAKAKFAAAWYREEKEKNPNASLADIAERIGDRHDTIKRMVAAIYVLDQAAEENIFKVDDRVTKRFPFSHLYTALARSEYMEYLGLSGGWAKHDPQPNPVETEKLDRLREVLYWIFGYKPDDIAPVIQSQNPDIKRLGDVLTSRAAVAILRGEKNLLKAYEQTTPAEEKFSAALVAAQRAVREAVNNLHAYDGRDRSLLDISKEVKESSDILTDRMERKFDSVQNSENKPSDKN